MISPIPEATRALYPYTGSPAGRVAIMNDNSVKEHLSILQAESERRRKAKEEGGDSGASQSPSDEQRKPRHGSKAVQTLKSKIDSGDYVRLIRDGHADRVHDMIRGATREIEIGRKTDRYSDAALEMTKEFEELAKEFPRKKELLARVEERIGPMRKLMSGQYSVEAIQETLGHDRATAEKLMRLLDDTSNLRDELVDTAARLMDLWDRIDEQARQDDKEEDQLRKLISEHLDHFSAQTRVRFEVSIERSLRNARLQQRLEVLRKFEKQLGENTPEGRARRKAELLPQGQELLQQGDYSGAVKVLEEAHQLDRGDEELLLLLADAYEGCGQLESAIKVLSRFVREEDSVPVLLALGGFLEKVERYQDALDVYRSALELKSEDVGMHVRYSRCLIHAGRCDEAYERLSELHATRPENPEVAVAFAEACDTTDRQLRARETLQNMAERLPDNVEVWDSLGRHFWQARELDEAKKAYQRVLQIDPQRFLALLRLGNLARQGGEFSEAVSHYRKAIEIDDTSAEAHLGLGIALRETSELSDALSKLERAVELGAEGGEIHHHLGLVYLKSGETQKASAAMQKAVSLGYQAA